ncbi:MAG: DUF943 family protein [Pantoea sp.]|nr:DUF943 family protein [Pantoea sp.]
MKKYRYLFIFSLLLFFFRLLLPVKIIGVHKLGETSTIVIVKNFPLTRMGKISWWQQHQSKAFCGASIKTAAIPIKPQG